MIITIDNISHYLLQEKIIDIEAIVDGDLRLVDNSRKNRNVKVLTKHGTSLLVKQPNIGDMRSIATIQREARFYDLIRTTPELTNIQSIIPKFVSFDRKQNILIVEFVEDSQSLKEYFYNISSDRFPTEPSFILGNIMAVYHKVFKNWIGSKIFSLFPRSYPSAFFIARPGPDIFSTLSPANLQLLKIIQRYPDILHHLSNLYNEWTTQTLIHGDIKWDNLIIKLNNNGDSQIGIKIVDWELCGIGDPCWDVGGAFQDFISFWLFSLPITGNEKPEQLIASAEYPLQNMKDSIRAFWRGYTKRAGIKGRQAHEFLYKSTKYCAARLIHKAYEFQQASSQISNTVIYILQTALNILNDIDNAIVQLLGIPLMTKGHEI
jgi:Phosphotransferase enzyme family